MRSLLILVVALALPSLAAAQQPEFMQPYGATTFPFSPVVRVGNMLYLAGQIGTVTGGGGALATGGIEAETRAAMLNIKDVLEKSGSDMEHVVKCTVFLADMKEWAAMNGVYRTFFRDGRFPARTAAGTSGLSAGARVEIECIAAVK